MDTKNKSPKIDNSKDKHVHSSLIDLKQLSLSDLNQSMMIKFTKNYEELQKQEIKNFLANEFGAKKSFSESFINKVLENINKSTT